MNALIQAYPLPFALILALLAALIESRITVHETPRGGGRFRKSWSCRSI